MFEFMYLFMNDQAETLSIASLLKHFTDHVHNYNMVWNNKYHCGDLAFMSQVGPDLFL